MKTTAPIFLDYNSTTPLDQRVLEKMLPYFSVHFGNASSKSHAYGWNAEAAVEKAREQTAALIQAEPAEIIFTSGATESINIALRGVVLSYHQKGNHIITCKTEHKAVLDTCLELEKQGANVTYLNVNHEGLIDIDELKSAFTDKTILVAIMMANNETGVIQPVEQIGEICRSKGVIFFSDTTQSIGKTLVDVNEIKADLICLSAHKFYGPKGVGALYIKRKNPRVTLKPVLSGGGHEKGLRPGTYNVPGIVGLGAACELTANSLWENAQHTSVLRTTFEQMIEEVLPVSINGSIRERLPNTTNIAFHGIKASALIKALPGLAFSTGSACTSALAEPSHVLKAMGFSEDHIYSSARFSFGKETTLINAKAAIAAIREAVANRIIAGI